MGRSSPSICVGMIKNAPYTSAQRTRNRYKRSERVRNGMPSVREDWQCHICHRWYSNYRGRRVIHLRGCEAKEAKQIAREELRRAQVAHLPSPDRFSPYSTLGSTSVSRSSTPEPPTVEGDAEHNGCPEDGLEHPGGSHRTNPPMVLEDVEDLGESKTFFELP